MRKHWNTEKGITLVELVAALALASIVMLLVYSVLMTGTKQYKNQLEKNNQLTDISYVLKVITRDIRKTENPQLISNSEINLNGNNYSKSGDNITRNGVVIASSVERFDIKEDDGKWIIEIKSSEQKGIKKTEIYLRTGDE
ncbi:prepilin-type N-terminal cleavage/methylation domain-containing protein [Psychrobacillus psychrotolerans]|uniref:Prepilin-type N-terminal cleavage/methylation domain-containing protein n=1 Tax=Psychrobacillus psychrotolerans TaxID=126156 RepID=A0A1I5YUT2_9BACI|nr:type II secretion system protein [Psychrobacillus psychrotolerans]SFQ47932.1 prepilin-type N-terminal cleavage/methylation domain-containing protein [Psychrobacillus psychrotolerans]